MGVRERGLDEAVAALVAEVLIYNAPASRSALFRGFVHRRGNQPAVGL
jgi:hypothetical protein